MDEVAERSHGFPAPCSTELLAVVEKHLPQRRLAIDLVSACDYDVRHACYQLQSTTLRKSSGNSVRDVSFDRRSPATLFQRQIDAIARADRWAYLKAAAEGTEHVRSIRRQAVEQLDAWEQASCTSHLAALAIGPDNCENPSWALEQKILEKAKSLSSAGRPTNEWTDEACIHLLELWAVLSEQRPRGPGREPKKGFDATATLPAFLRDALMVYRHCGLGAHAWPGTKEKAWSRILRRYREEFSA